MTGKLEIKKAKYTDAKTTETFRAFLRENTGGDRPEKSNHAPKPFYLMSLSPLSDLLPAQWQRDQCVSLKVCVPVTFSCEVMHIYGTATALSCPTRLSNSCDRVQNTFYTLHTPLPHDSAALFVVYYS